MNNEALFDHVSTSLFNLLVSHKISEPPKEENGKGVKLDISYYAQLSFQLAEEYVLEREKFFSKERDQSPGVSTT